MGRGNQSGGTGYGDRSRPLAEHLDRREDVRVDHAPSRRLAVHVHAVLLGLLLLLLVTMATSCEMPEPSSVPKLPDESWVEYRDRRLDLAQRRARGLGPFARQVPEVCTRVTKVLEEIEASAAADATPGEGVLHPYGYRRQLAMQHLAVLKHAEDTLDRCVGMLPAQTQAEYLAALQHPGGPARRSGPPPAPVEVGPRASAADDCARTSDFCSQAAASALPNSVAKPYCCLDVQTNIGSCVAGLGDCHGGVVCKADRDCPPAESGMMSMGCDGEAKQCSYRPLRGDGRDAADAAMNNAENCATLTDCERYCQKNLKGNAALRHPACDRLVQIAEQQVNGSAGPEGIPRGFRALVGACTSTVPTGSAAQAHQAQACRMAGYALMTGRGVPHCDLALANKLYTRACAITSDMLDCGCARTSCHECVSR